MLLGEFGFHSGDGGTDEEVYKVFICAFYSNLLEGGDISGAVFQFNNE